METDAKSPASGANELDDLQDGDGWDDEADEASWVHIKPRKRDLRPRDVAEVAEVAEREGVTTTYKPSRHEASWLFDSLGAFYEQNLIRDVLYLVKGGKEANVYCCEAGTASANGGAELVAAKVYRPRKFRNLRNDQLYREGRPVLNSEGRVAKNSDGRLMRALGKKTDFGAQVQHTSWLMYEYTTLGRLHEAGVPVPAPLAASDNALLMGYVGSREGAAPTLIETSLRGAAHATALFRATLRAIETMLREGIIHGDLSAYNLLYWEDQVTLIDFPQVVNPESNPNAPEIFERDVTRVCDYFARQGASAGCDNPAALARDIWRRCYVEGGGEKRMKDESRP